MRKFFCYALFLLFTSLAYAQAAHPLQLIQQIPLEHVEGRLDHFSIDIKNQRLFIAAFGNNSVEIVDLKAGKQLPPLKNIHEPQGALYIEDQNLLAVTSAPDGTCTFFDAESFQVKGTVSLGSDADNLRYDAHDKLIYVGYGEGAIAVIDAVSLKHLGDISLKGHPESFQIERDGKKIFVNVPDTEQISVADKIQRTVITSWPVTARSNFPLALDEEHHRLFVGCRAPAKLMVMDAESGHLIATLDAVGDVDDIFYDAKSQRVYLSGGQGSLQVVASEGADKYRTVDKIQTSSGARTSLFVPELNRLFVAVPHRNSQPAQIRVYTVSS